MPYLRLPSGSYVEVPEGMSEIEALTKARAQFKEEFQPIKPESGGVAAAKAGFEELKGDIAALAGRTGLMEPEAAEKYRAARKRAQERIFKPTEESWLDAPFTKLSELAGGSAAYMAAPAVAGGAALLGGAPALAVAGAAGLTSAAQFAASNLGRQMEEGKTLRETDLGSALAAAPFQAALDVTAGRLIPGIGRIFGAAGRKVTPEIAKKIAEQGLSRAALDYGIKTGAVATAEGLTEAGQQLLERLQAGLNITDAAARDEYFQSFIGGAALGGTLALPGRYVERRGIVAKGKEIERKQAEEKAAAEQAAEEEKKAAMAQMQQIAAEQKPTEVDVARREAQLEQTRRQIFDQERVLNQELDSLRAQATTETDVDKLAGISARAETIQSALDELNPEKIGQQINKISKETNTLNKELKAAQKEKNQEAVTTLQQQIERNNQTTQVLKDRLEAIKSAPAPAPEKIKLADVLKQIDKARETGELAELGKLVKKYKTLQAEYAGEQPSLFEETKEGIRYPEEQRQQILERKEKQEADFQKALAEAAEKATPKATEVVKPATEEDIAAQRKLQSLRKERERLEEMFRTANETNDIRTAYDLQTRIIPQKDAEIAELEKGKKELPTEYGVDLFDTVKEAKEIGELKNKIKSLDDELKKAAATTKALEKEGALTKEGERLAGVQRQRDELLQEVSQRETKLNDINIQQGVEAQLTEQIKSAFPERGPQVAFLDKASALRRHIGNRLGLRANLMGLQRKLQIARRRRQDREGAFNLINQMRDLLERLTAFENESLEIPIPDGLPEKTKQYYKQLNEIRVKQQRATDVYLASLQSLARRDYIGGETKKAKATKQVLEKRVADNSERLTNSFLEEIALHRKVTGKPQLDDAQKETYTKQFAETFGDFKRLAEGELAASDAAQAVLAEQITNIIQTASNQTAITAEKPLLKTQFGKRETEVRSIDDEIARLQEQRKTATGAVAEGIDKDIARLQEQKIDLGKIGFVEQRDLFGERQLEPIVTKRATHQNFMRFVAIQGQRYKFAQQALQKALAAAQRPLKTTEERVRDYSKKVGEYTKLVNSVLEETKEEARQRAKTEVQTKSRQLRKEALAISEQLYGAQLKALETNLRTMQKEQKEFVRLVNKLKDGALKKAALRKIHDTDKEIESLQNSVNTIYKNFNDAIDLAPVKEEERLFKQYVAADPVLKSVKAALKRKQEALNKALDKHEQNLEEEGRKRRAAQALAEPQAKDLTPEQVAAEERLVSRQLGLELPGIRVTGNVIVEKQKLATLKEKLVKYLKAGNKKSATETRRAIAEQQKIVDNLVTPTLTAEQKAEKREAKVAELSRKSVEYTKERAELKQRQAEMRRKEGIEFAQRKRAELKQRIANNQEKIKEAPTKEEKDALAKQIAADQKALKEVKAVPTEERIPPSKRQVGPATREVRPPQMKTGVAKGRGAKDIEAGIKRGAKAFEKVDFETESRETGLSAEAFGDLFRDISNNDVDYRVEETGAAGQITKADVNKQLANIKLPKGLQIDVLENLSPSLEKAIESQGYSPKNIKGGVLQSGKVFIVAGNHKNIKDLQKTIAHELIGHVGVEGLLGEKGMADLVKKVSEQKGGVWELAKKLGVMEDAEAAYLAAAKAGKNREEALAAAVKEMIAHTEEARFDKNLLQTAKAFIEALVGAVRSALRKAGLNLDISTNDIYKLLRDARRNFSQIAPGAYSKANGDIVFRNKEVFNTEFADIGKDTDLVVAKQRSWADGIKASANGLLFRTKYIDRFAPIEAIAKKIKDSLEATQLMYFLRMHDQRLNWTAEIASNGPLDIIDKKRADGRVEKIIESKKGVSLKDIAEVLRGANVGSPQATNRVFTFYLAAKRAERVGIEKLNFGKDVTPELLKKVVDKVKADKKTLQAFEKARELYNDYNDGLINFAVKTGAISKQLGQQLLKTRDYVPFYRADPNGDINLEISGAPVIRIGSLKDQPYLHELVGGDSAIMDFFTSSLQNTNLLTDMALRNLATRNVAFSLNEMTLLKPISDKIKTGIRKGQGPASPKTIRFKIDGEDYHAIVDTDTVGVPAELLVKGMEGVKTSMPDLVRWMGTPASTLRKFITRNPAYALRQVVRDSLAATMTSGSNAAPLLGAFKELGTMVRGKSEGEFLLQKRGVLGGQVMTGSSEDMKQIMLQITSGKPGWNTALAKLDQLAIKGDAASRVTMYNSFLKQGLSEMEATLATLESMNFSKRGISPSVFLANQLIPFFNAQVQGLDVIYRAFTKQMPFSEKLQIKEKLIKRGLMMAGFTLAYAALMQDDEAYQNANDDEKYGNWFVRIPGMEEPLKVPIPFELGLLFKAIPEAVLNTAFGDEKLKDTGKAIGTMLWQSVPGSYPAAIKPLIEVYMNKSFFTGRPIESERLQQFEASERYTDRTTEIAKILGKATGLVGLSPVKLEYLVRGYTGALPLGVISLSNPVLRSGEAGEMPTTRPSELPLVGTLFQPKDASGLINKAYNEVDEIVQKKQTYKKMMEEGRESEAEEFYDANADIIGMASLAGGFRQRMGELTKQERQVRADSGLSGAEKRAELERIKEEKIDLAKELMRSRE